MAQASNRAQGLHNHQHSRVGKCHDPKYASNNHIFRNPLPNELGGFILDHSVGTQLNLPFIGYHENGSDVWNHSVPSLAYKGFDPRRTEEPLSMDLYSNPSQVWSYNELQDPKFPIYHNDFSFCQSPSLSPESVPSRLSHLGSIEGSRSYMGSMGSTSNMSHSTPTHSFSDSRSNGGWNGFDTQDLKQHSWPYSPTTSVKEESRSRNSETIEHITSSPRPRGRHGKLTDEKRNKAAMMRRLGSCDTCKRRKSSCDEHTPCASCISYYGQKLQHNPCRGKFATQVRDLLLDARIKWYASPDFLGQSRGRQILPINEMVTDLPISFGNGPWMNVDAQIILSPEHSTFQHYHIAHYDDNDSRGQKEEMVLPAIISDPSSLDSTIDLHFDKLVRGCHELPSVGSLTRLITPVFKFNQNLLKTPLKCYDQILHEALKLLLIIQISREVKVPSPWVSTEVYQVCQGANMFPSSSDCEIIPCFLRADIGGRMLIIADKLMNRCLEYLEHLQLGKRCEDFPMVLALMMVFAKIIETIQIHATRDGLHDHFSDRYYDGKHMQEMRAERDKSTNLARTNGERAFEMLLRMHGLTFRNCHNQLQRLDPYKPHSSFSLKQSSGRSRSNSADTPLSNDPQNQFLQEISLGIAENRRYLEQKATYEPDNGIGMDFVDRLVSRVLLLR